MKNNLLIFLLLFISQNTISQNMVSDTLPPGISSRQVIRQNKIDTVILHIKLEDEEATRYFNFDSMGRTESILILDNFKNKLFEAVFFYDPTGQLVQVNEKHTISGRFSESKSTCTYDSLGRQIKVITLNNGDSAITTLRYLPGKIIQELISKKGVRYIIDNSYDEQNRLIQVLSIDFEKKDSIGKIVKSRQLTYDKKGNIRLEIDSTSRRIDSTIYDYDDNNRIITLTKRRYFEKYYYNTAGLVIKREITKTDDFETFSVFETYEYIMRK